MIDKVIEKIFFNVAQNYEAVRKMLEDVSTK